MGIHLNSDIGPVVGGQDIYELSATQKHKLGTRLVRGGKVYVYAKAAATLNTDVLALCNREQDVAYRSIAADVAAGNDTITITTTTGDGQASDGAIAKNELEGGSCIIFPGSENSINMGILSNSAVTASSHTMTVVLDGDLPIDITTSHSVECVSSPYLDIVATDTYDNYYHTPVGLPMRAATTTDPYVWLQTWGICWIAPANGYGDANPGTAAHNHALVCRYNGSVQTFDSDVTESEHAARVGYVMFKGKSNGQGAPFMMLQISP